MVSFTQKESYDIEDLLTIVQLLRAPGGCPWDREQTHQSIRKNLLEESYEVAEAIDRADSVLLCEELGDLLLQVALHTEIERERGVFDFSEVADGICKKLILRHPHVFGAVSVTGSEEVLENWDRIKKESKGQATAGETLESVPGTLPALMRADKLQSRAAKAGFEYPALSMAVGDLKSELLEFLEAEAQKDRAAMQEELGDLLFSVVNVARISGIEPEEALTAASDKFTRRFIETERLATEKGIALKGTDMAVLDDLWRQAKKRLLERS